MVAFDSSATAAVFEVSDTGDMVRIDDVRIDMVKVPIAAPFTTSATAARHGSARSMAASTALTAARARLVQPLIAAASARYGVAPALVDAIAHTESRYNQAAISAAGAGGVMQLMPGTARDLGVDRHEIAANIAGGTAYLRQMLDRYDGNVVCAIAAYNAGPGAVSQNRCVPPYRETIAYVAKVMDRLSAAAR